MPALQERVKIPTPVLGVRPDVSPLDLGAAGLVSAENWIYRNGLFRSRPGLKAFANSVAQRPLGFIEYVHNNGTSKIIMGTAAGWWSYDFGTAQWTNITQGGNALTGSPADQVIFRVFQKAGQSWLLGTNGANTAKKWDGLAANYLDMGGTPPRARTMMVLADYILLGNLLSGSTVSGAAVDISKNKDFDSGWGTILVAILGDTPGAIMSMLEMGNFSGAIYKTDAVYMAYAQSAFVPFRFELKQANIHGPVSPLAVVTLPDGSHAYLALDGDVKRFSGGEVTSLSRAIREHIVAVADFGLLDRAWGWSDHQNNEIGFVFPQRGTGEPNVGVIISLSNLALWPIRFQTLRPTAGKKLDLTLGVTIGELVGTIGEQVRTIGEYGSKHPRLVFGDVGGQVYDDTGLSDSNVAFPSHWETGLHDFEGNGSWKTLQELEHYFKRTPATQPFKTMVGISDYGEDRALSAAQTGDAAAAGPYRFGFRDSGQFLSMRVEADIAQELHWLGGGATVAFRGRR